MVFYFLILIIGSVGLEGMKFGNDYGDLISMVALCEISFISMVFVRRKFFLGVRKSNHVLRD